MFKKDQLNQLALPLILSNVVSLVISLCDQAVMGHLSITSFAAVGIVAGFINSVTGVLGATSISFNILGARVYQNQSLFRKYLETQVILSLLIGLLGFGFITFGGKFIFQQIYQLNAQVLEESLNYAYIFSSSIGLNLLLFTCSSYLKIINRTKYILIGNTVATISNVILDLLFVYGLGLGMIGNAVGSVLALILNLIIYLVLLKCEIRWEVPLFRFSLIKENLQYAFPMMVQEFLENTILIVVLGALISRIGLLEVSVYQLINNLLQISWMPMYAYAQATLTIVSENPKCIVPIHQQAITRSIRLYALISVFLVLNQNFIINLITNQKLLLEYFCKYFPMVIILFIFNNMLTIYQYTLQTLGEQKGILKTTLLIYSIGYLLIYLFAQLYKSLWIVYVILAMIYFILSRIMKLKLKINLDKHLQIPPCL